MKNCNHTLKKDIGIIAQQQFNVLEYRSNNVFQERLNDIIYVIYKCSVCGGVWKQRV